MPSTRYIEQTCQYSSLQQAPALGKACQCGTIASPELSNGCPASSLIEFCEAMCVTPPKSIKVSFYPCAITPSYHLFTCSGKVCMINWQGHQFSCRMLQPPFAGSSLRKYTTKSEKQQRTFDTHYGYLPRESSGTHN